jgi:hypothetical protein
LDAGLPIAAEALDLETYIVLALFAGSSPIQSVEGDLQPLAFVRKTFEASEACRRLIGLAVMLRGILESRSASSGTVGSWTVTGPGQSTQPLSLREACNKIIHATDIDLYEGCDAEHAPLSRTIRLHGQHGKNEWQAELDVFEYLAQATYLF